MSKEYLVFTTRTEVRSTHISRDGTEEIDSSNPFKPIKNLTNVVGVDFDYKSGTLYFTQIGGDARIAKMNSQNPGTNSMENILDKGINPEGIAFDWVHQKIYWTDSRNRSVYSMNTDGSQIGKIHFYCRLWEYGLSSFRGGIQNRISFWTKLKMKLLFCQ